MFKKMLFLLLALMIPIFAIAQSSGKIMGVVTDKETGEPLPGVNVIIQETYLGATTDVDGYFVILNVPVGAYNIEASYVGYQTMVFEGIRVSAGTTTEQDFDLMSTTLELGEAVVVLAERPLVEKHVTQSISKITIDELEAIPVRGLQNLLALQASVVVQDGNVYIRGGRNEEVGFYLDGASTIDPLDRTNNIHIIQDAVEEIQVLTGGFTAEFGDANAGIVRSELRTGGSDLHFSLDAQTDKFAAEGEKFLGTTSYREHIISATASGPLLYKDLRFFVAVENQDIGDIQKRVSEGFEFGHGMVMPDGRTFELVSRNPNNSRDVPLLGDGSPNPAFNPDTIYSMKYPDGFTPKNWLDRWAVNSTLLYNLNPFNFRLSAVYNWTKDYQVDNPMIDIFNTREFPRTTNTLLLTGKFTHVLGPKTYYDLKLSYYNDNYEREDDWFGTDWKSWSDSAKIDQYTNGDVVWAQAFQEEENLLLHGISFNRNGDAIFNYRKGEQFYFGGSVDFVSQFTKNHELRFGMDARQYTIRRFEINTDVMSLLDAQDSTIQLVDEGAWKNYLGNTYGYDRFGNEISSGWDGPKKPLYFSAYFQDKIEYRDLIINAGLRYDYFNTDDRELRDPTNPDLDTDIGIVEYDEWKKKDALQFVSPRLGISFPISERTIFYTQYGKFVQMPEFNDFYYNSDFFGEQISGGNYFITPVGFGMEPIRTTAYEVGFKKQVTDLAAFDITGFYKNIKGEPQATRITPAPGSEAQAYNIITNGDFATIKGLEFKLTLRRTNRLQAQLNYTLSDAEGTGSGETSYLGATDRISAIPTVMSPLDYNQTHRGAVNLDYRFGKDDGGMILEQSGLNLLFTFNSGHPYTYTTSTGSQANAYDEGVDYMYDTRSRTAEEPINSSTTPWNYRIDLRLDKTVNITDKISANLYLRVYNLFNTKNVINVFEMTGSAEDDGFINNPLRVKPYTDAYGGQDYIDMYKAINIDNGQAYWDILGRQLYDQPRQIFLGIKFIY